MKSLVPLACIDFLQGLILDELQYNKGKAYKVTREIEVLMFLDNAGTKRDLQEIESCSLKVRQIELGTQIEYIWRKERQPLSSPHGSV